MTPAELQAMDNADLNALAVEARKWEPKMIKDESSKVQLLINWADSRGVGHPSCFARAETIAFILAMDALKESK